MKTAQQLFDIMYIHVVRQGKPALSGLPGYSASCAYRGRDGSKCAFGVLIPDELYHRVMEGKTAADLIQQARFGTGWPLSGRYVQWYDEMVGEYGILVRAMQQCHDDASSTYVRWDGGIDEVAYVSDFKERAAKVAHTWGLVIPEVV